jgi:hypothetical protein
MQTDGWTEAQLAQLQNAWAELDFVASLETELLGQRAMFLHMLAWVREEEREKTGRTATEGSFGGRFYSRSSPGSDERATIALPGRSARFVHAVFDRRKRSR